MSETSKNKATSGQPRRASDSRPRPGSGTPSMAAPTKGAAASGASTSKGEPKPSTSKSPLDPGRPTKT